MDLFGLVTIILIIGIGIGIIIFYNKVTPLGSSSGDGILLPLYIYPDDEIYETVGRNMPMQVVINPDNGNGQINEDWDRSLRLMKQAAGDKWKPLYGYVYTNYAIRPLEEVFVSIDKYMDQFNLYVSHIFLDEVATSNVSYYELINQYVEQKYPECRLILNPGTKPTDSKYFDLSRLYSIVVYEGPEPQELDTLAEGVPLNKSSVIINNPRNIDPENEKFLLYKLENLGFNAYYVTSNNNYTTLPAYIN